MPSEAEPSSHEVPQYLKQYKEDLQDEVNQFVDWLFNEFPPPDRTPRGPKVINDALLGNEYFAAHEVALIDSPFLQRLKDICQTGLVHHVYPSARHSRFEHILGTATIAERTYKAIRDRGFLEESEEDMDLETDRREGDMAELRAAALLHDVGHGMFSHLSEQIYERYTYVGQLIDRHPDFAKSAPGEIISYLMVRSPIFKKWFEDICDECGARIRLDRVSEMILGTHQNPDKLFLGQIISSPYDADKLDYIARDSYHCGLALTVDLPRFYSMIATGRLKGKRTLVLRSYIPLEQILFSKMTLFGSVYHHQKVKCLDHMVRAMIRHVSRSSEDLSLCINGRSVSFSSPIDYLYPTDSDFLGAAKESGDPFLQRMVRRLERRDLLKRSVEVSRRTVRNWDEHHRTKFTRLHKKPDEQEALESRIYNALPKTVRDDVHAGEVLLSVPHPPRIKGDHAFVQTRAGDEVVEIERFFPVSQWNQSYAHNKWRSYVYAPSEHREAVRSVAIPVLSEEYDLDISQELSDSMCHVG